MRGAAVLSMAGCLLFGATLPGPAVAQETHLLIVSGIGGDPAYSERFAGWARSLREAAIDRWALPEDRVTVLGEDAGAEGVDARSDAETVRATLARLASNTGAGDAVWIVLFGHGSADPRGVRFNLPGRDLAAEEWGRLLDDFSAGQQLVFVNTSASSGGFLPAVAAEGRTVITATRSAGERIATRFPEFFVEALESDRGDLDRDGRVTALEAYTFARAEVARSYERENLLQPEHALLDDDGDGEGTGDPEAEDAADGRLAATLALTPGRATPQEIRTDDPVLRTLYAERRAIQDRIDAHRARAGELPEEEYEATLEELLVELALKNREIRQREEEGEAQ